jgi:hypothetical protein
MDAEVLIPVSSEPSRRRFMSPPSEVRMVAVPPWFRIAARAVAAT